MKPSRSLVFVSAVTLAIALAAASVFVRRAHSPHAEAPAIAQSQGDGPPLRLAWKKGEAHVYRFAWDTATVLRAPGLAAAGTDEMRGAASFAGELTLRCFGAAPGGDGQLLGASIGALTAHRLEVLGKDALPDDPGAKKAFAGREALVDVDAQGGVRAMYLPADAPEIFRHTMRTLLTQLHVTVRDDVRAWSASEPAPAGRTEVAWARTSHSTLVRTRARYEALSALPPSLSKEHDDTLESRSTLTLAEGGFIETLRDAEILGVDAKKDAAPLLRERSTFALDHLRSETFDADAPDTSRLQAWHPGEVEVNGASVERQELTQLAAGMSVSGVAQQMFLVGVGQQVPSDFLLRAMALLRLQPALCADVLRLAEQRGMPPAGRELAADVLAAAGHAEAQAALRTLLHSPVVRDDGTQQRHVLQRLGFVAAPLPETVATVSRAYQSATARKDEDGRLAAAYTLGATAAHLAHRGDQAAARAIAEGLARDLDASKQGDDRRGLVAALGNAGLASTLPALRTVAEDTDPSLRAEAAHALRKIEGDGARDLLQTMAADADGVVSRNAIDALGQRALGDDDVRRLAALVQRGGVPLGAIATVLTVLSKHLQPAAEVEAALRALAARVPGDTDVQGRVEALLAQLHGSAG